MREVCKGMHSCIGMQDTHMYAYAAYARMNAMRTHIVILSLNNIAGASSEQYRERHIASNSGSLKGDEAFANAFAKPCVTPPPMETYENVSHSTLSPLDDILVL